LPTWNGNEFLLADGCRPGIRTLTPRRFDAERRELDIEVVVHDRGLASDWAQSVQPGSPAAVSGPGRGYVVDVSCRTYLLGGDETAIPAISQLLEALPAEASVQVGIEIAHPDARLELPGHPRATVTWCDRPGGEVVRPGHSDQTSHDVTRPQSEEPREPSAPDDEQDATPSEPEPAVGEALLAWIRNAELSPETQVWVAGEAAAVQRIRRHLFEERALPRSQATVRGYWKYGRSGEAGDDRP
jgi:NADPH-dependent ferric siderophore reductase